MNIIINTTLEADVRIEPASERPAATHNEYSFTYPGERLRDGALLKVFRERQPGWVGLFSPGQSGFSGAASCSLGQRIVVVSNGAAYLVDVERPERYECLDSSFVTGMRVVSDAGVVVLFDFWGLWGIGADGILWHTETQADGIEITRIVEQRICGLLAIPGAMPSEFSIDCRTGRIEE